MANPVWPAGLPQVPLKQGFSKKPKKQVISSPVERGKRKIRRKTTGKISVIAAVYRMTQAQFDDIFEPFFDTTLGGGALPFDLPDPKGGAGTLAVTFNPDPDAPYDPRESLPGKLDVVVQLETLP